MSAVFSDPDRSVERAVELGIQAGIAHERERMRAIFELQFPPARGIETAVRMRALSGDSLEQIKALVEFMSTNISADDLARYRRGEFRTVAADEIEKADSRELQQEGDH